MKGLYKKARAGQIKNFTGVDDPYEPPLQPEVKCNTATENADESLHRILVELERRAFVPPSAGAADVSSDDEAAALRTLKQKGYI